MQGSCCAIGSTGVWQNGSTELLFAKQTAGEESWSQIEVQMECEGSCLH